MVSSWPSSCAITPWTSAALVAAFSYVSRVLLERHISGRDVAVSVIDRLSTLLRSAIAGKAMSS